MADESTPVVGVDFVAFVYVNPLGANRCFSCVVVALLYRHLVPDLVRNNATDLLSPSLGNEVRVEGFSADIVVILATITLFLLHEFVLIKAFTNGAYLSYMTNPQFDKLFSHSTEDRETQLFWIYCCLRSSALEHIGMFMILSWIVL